MRRRTLLGLALTGLLTFAPFAAAQESPAPPASSPQAAAPAPAPAPLPPLVLDASGAAGLSAERLRAAIAAETHREVVLPTDPRATLGGERLQVMVAEGRARVRFAPSTREHDMPSEADAEAQLRQIALLAASVVAGEADDILAELRKKKSAAALQKSQLQGGEGAPASGAESSKADEVAYERIEGTLRYLREGTGVAQIAPGLAAVGTSLAVVPVGYYIRGTLNERALGDVVAGVGYGLFSVGLFDFIWSLSEGQAVGNLHRQLLSQHGSQPTGVLVHDVEEQWREKGARWTKTGRWIGGGLLAVGVLGAAVGSIAVATASDSAQGKDLSSKATVSIGTGAIVAMYGLVALLRTSPVENSYEAYARASKRLTFAPGIAPLPGASGGIGGVAFSLSGRF